MLGHRRGRRQATTAAPQLFNRVRAERDSGMIDAEAMNSVTEKKLGRGSILTKDVMAGIPVLVQQGLDCRSHRSPNWLHSRHLRVRCCHAGISLRVPKEVKVVPLVPLVPASRPSRHNQSGSLPLPRRPHCNSAKLRCPGCASGGSNRHDRSRACHEPT